jgi:DNA-binding GntR family transcriptional regulator
LTEKIDIRYMVYRMPSSLLKLKSFAKPILRDEVYLSIKEAILTGELAPGERISIGRLLPQIGFSPTPIREALLKLEQEGFVSRLQRGGFIVSRFTKKDIEEIFEIRDLLECYAVGLAMNHVQPNDIRWLEKNVEESKQYVAKNKLAKVSALNTQFHDYLNGLSKNDRLLFLINEMKDRIYLYRSAILRVPDKAGMSIDHHGKMIQAIKKKDVDTLKRLTREHIQIGKEVIFAEIEKGTLKL